MASSDSMSLDQLLEVGALHPPGTSTSPDITSSAKPGGATGGNTNNQRNPILKGYSKKILNGLIHPKVLCAQCDNVLREPVQSKCGHRYCRDCYTNLVESKPAVKCGACIKDGDGDEEFASLTLDGMYPDHAIRKDMSNMKSECKHPGCEWVGTFARFLKHETECQFKQKKCNCNMMVGAKKMEEHEKTECLLRTIICLFCHLSLLAKDQTVHERSCELVPEKCNGCGSEIPRNQMASHIDPIKGNCKNRKCPFGCDIINSSGHQVEKVIDHMMSLLIKVMTLKDKMEHDPKSSENDDNNALTQRFGELESKINDIKLQAQTLDRSGRDAGTSRQGEAAAHPGGNATLAAVTEKQSTIESLVAVLNRQLEKVIAEYNGLEHQRRLQNENADLLQRKVTSLERSMALKDVALAEQDLRIQALEQTTFDGVLVWAITDFRRKLQEATSGRTLSIYSAPFYTSRSGYKMCCRIYLNGDGMGKTTHISLFFVVMKGKYDAILAWPFRQKVTLMLLDQDNKNHLIDAFRPDPTSTSFRRPVSDMNIASGCPLFCPLGKLEERKPAYVKDDTIFIKAIVDQTGL